MEGELIIVSIVSGIFTVITISLLNRNWFLRQKVKYDFEKYKVKARSAGKAAPKTPAPQGALEWIDKLKGMDPDLLHDAIDMLQGQGSEGGGGGLGDIATPEVIQAVLQGISQAKNKQTPDATFES